MRGLPWKPPGALRGGFAPFAPLIAFVRPFKGRTAHFGRATEGSAPLTYNYSLARGIYGLFCSLTKSSFCAIAVCGLPPPVEVGTSVSAGEASDRDYHKSTLILYNCITLVRGVSPVTRLRGSVRFLLLFPLRVCPTGFHYRNSLRTCSARPLIHS